MEFLYGKTKYKLIKAYEIVRGSLMFSSWQCGRNCAEASTVYDGARGCRVVRRRYYTTTSFELVKQLLTCDQYHASLTGDLPAAGARTL